MSGSPSDSCVARPLTSLPVRDPGALYLLGDASQSGTGSGDPTGKFVVGSNALYHTLQSTHVFDGLCAVQSQEVMPVSIRGTHWSVAQPGHAKLVSGNYFDVLGADAALGRTLAPSDDSAPAAPVGVVSYRYWKDVLNGDPAAVGSVLDVTGIPVSIVGVAAPTFYGQTLQPDPPDIWLPLSVDRRLEPELKLLDSPETRWLYLMGRLSPSISPAQAQVRLTAALQNWIFGTFSSDISSDADRQEVLRSYIKLTPAGGGSPGCDATTRKPCASCSAPRWPFCSSPAPTSRRSCWLVGPPDGLNGRCDSRWVAAVGGSSVRP